MFLRHTLIQCLSPPRSTVKSGLTTTLLMRPDFAGPLVVRLTGFHCTGKLLGQPGKMLGGNLRWSSIPPRESSNTPSWLCFTETWISSGSVGQFGPSVALLTFERTLDCSRASDSRQAWSTQLLYSWVGWDSSCTMPEWALSSPME